SARTPPRNGPAPGPAGPARCRRGSPNPPGRPRARPPPAPGRGAPRRRPPPSAAAPRPGPAPRARPPPAPPRGRPRPPPPPAPAPPPLLAADRRYRQQHPDAALHQGPAVVLLVREFDRARRRRLRVRVPAVVELRLGLHEQRLDERARRARLAAVPHLPAHRG